MSDKQPSSAKRFPQQARGRERVTNILNACARVLIAEGEVGVSTHRLAKEAGTSVGSLYHFFADKDEVLSALSARHRDAFVELIAEIGQTSDSAWRELTATGVIARLAMPSFEYLNRNRDLLVLLGITRIQVSGAEALQVEIGRLYDHVLALRMPRASEEERQSYAQALMGLPTGLLQIASVNTLVKEVPRALIAYLEAVELLHRDSSSTVT
jgi:AcrR family transcriptional regulator